MSLAMRAAGYETQTVVQEVFAINNPADFDREVNAYFAGGGSRWVRGLGLLDYAVFSSLLGRYDVFHFFFDGGFLRRTPFRFLELKLLHLAGKKVIVMPYGSDVAIPSEIKSDGWRRGLAAHYPLLASTESRRRRWIRHFCAHADYVVTGLVHFETLPRWDLLTIQYYPIDAEAWAPDGSAQATNGIDGPVVVVHAPNHRELKGTQALIDACEELRLEGFAVSLRLLEKVPNHMVKVEMQKADIVAEQFILGYGLTAIEGMSVGKPVLSNLSDERYYEPFRNITRLSACPIVSTTPGALKDALRLLIADPDRRRALGSAGRQYVLREHSYEAMASLWDAIYRRVWLGEDVDPSSQLRDTATYEREDTTRMRPGMIEPHHGMPT